MELFWRCLTFPPPSTQWIRNTAASYEEIKRSRLQLVRAHGLGQCLYADDTQLYEFASGNFQLYFECLGDVDG